MSKKKCKHKDNIKISDNIATQLFSVTCLDCGKGVSGFKTIMSAARALKRI